MNEEQKTNMKKDNEGGHRLKERESKKCSKLKKMF